MGDSTADQHNDLPLDGIRVVELASIGPGPFTAMMLADHGADVIRIEKPGGRDVGTGQFDRDPMLRGRRKVELDLKEPNARDKALALIEKADVLLEGFRPGVTERLGLGPEACHGCNPALVYGRMTGWGQTGPLAPRAGHDINYIALTGALDAIGTQESGPVPPINLVGDFGGGGMLLAYGICAALLPAKLKGKGCVVDAAMVEGAALLMTMPFALKAQGLWGGGRGGNFLDGGAPYYGTYETKDGLWVGVGAIEEPFWRELVAKLELNDPLLAQRHNPQAWPDLKALFSATFKTKTRAEWEAIFQGSDACVAPALSMDEVKTSAHNQDRGVFQTLDGITQPIPAPRYNGTMPTVPVTDMTPVDYETVLDEWSTR
ncbi:MAG: CaiB/BaiF CoA-transferase family protein [Pseudomonadota bacterium]